MVIKEQELLTVFPETSYYLSYELMNTIISYQRAWSQYVNWLRNSMYSTLEGSPSLTSVTNQLYSMVSDFYGLFRIFYGPEVSQNLYNYLLGFTASISGLIEGMKNNDQAVIDTNTKQLYQTADNLSVFLAQINPFWEMN